jgi:hypothetical protein
MTISDWISGIAVIIASVLTLVITTVYTHYQQKRQDRMNIFRTLASYQCAEISPRKTEAINLIRIVFYRYNDVISAYNKYLSILKTMSNQTTFDEIQDAYVTLLEELAKNLGYKKIDWKILKEIYKPKAAIDNEHLQSEMMWLVCEYMSNFINQKRQGSPEEK